jgi:MFS family permease
VIAGYALAIRALLLPKGRPGDMVGWKHVYIAGFAIFVVTSALGGASPMPFGVSSALVLGSVGPIGSLQVSSVYRPCTLCSSGTVSTTGMADIPGRGGRIDISRNAKIESPVRRGGHLGLCI